MTSKSGLFDRGRSIRYPILAIAWIPSLLLILVGLGTAGSQIYDGRQIRATSESYDAVSAPVAAFQSSLFLERRLSQLYSADPTSALASQLLADGRRQVDATLGEVQPLIAQESKKQPVFAGLSTALTKFRADLPSKRRQLDGRELDLIQVSQFYSAMVQDIEISLVAVARAQPITSSGVEQTVLISFIRANDALQEADTLALASFLGDGLSPAEFGLFVARLGEARQRYAEVQPLLPPSGQAQLDAAMSGTAGRKILAAHDQVLQAGPNTRAANPGDSDDRSEGGVDAVTSPTRSAMPMQPATWNAAIAKLIGVELTPITIELGRLPTQLSRDEGDKEVTRWTMVGIALLVLGIAVFVLTTLASNRLVRRLQRLRSETLTLSRERLPNIIGRLRSGRPVDVDAEVPPLQFGKDEIGQVAEAFDEAQRMAVNAAAREAETRAGLRTVFLDIAHRNQSIVHRQLDVLDQAERAQEDPDQLALLFQLDHLSTRARRNAENLIILGGGTAGRQWRFPVPLMEVTRSAISEAENYIRVQVTSVPEVFVKGGAVGDVIHLVAELVDNATRFSPPKSRIEVRGNLAGRGVVLEVEDQGIGIEDDLIEELNQVLHDPPDFQVMALAEEPRLGLFVVAQLAARHGIRVTLTPSPAYGGTRVIVLLPNEIISQDGTDTGETPALDAPDRLGNGGRMPAELPVSSTPSIDTVLTAPEMFVGEPDPGDRARPAAESVGPSDATPPAGFRGSGTPASRPEPADTGFGAGTGRYVPSSPATSSAPASSLPADPYPSSYDTFRSESPVDLSSGSTSSEYGRSSEYGGESYSRDFGADDFGRESFGSEPGPSSFPATSSTATSSAAAGARPELPRRSRQAHLSPRLRDTPGDDTDSGSPAPAETADPSAARDRMSALQRGTMRGRTADPEA